MTMKVSNNKMNMPPPTAATAIEVEGIRRRLRGSPSSPDYHIHRRALHGDQSLFDNPGSGGSGSSGTNNSSSSTQRIEDTYYSQRVQQQLQRHSASWGTYASFFLLTQGIAILCTIAILIYCIRKHRHQMIRRRIASMVQMHHQEWATMHTTTSTTTTPSDMTAIGVVESSGVGQSSGNTGEAEVVAAARDASSGDGDAAGLNNNNISNTNNPSPFDRFLSISRTVGNTIMHPFRALGASINNWATGSYDEVFLRQLMERMEAERDAAKENPKDRARRLKEAFVKAGTVWELNDEHFRPPTTMGNGSNSLQPIPNGDGIHVDAGIKDNNDKAERHEIDEHGVDEQPRGEQRERGQHSSSREASETNAIESGQSVVGMSEDSLEPNQRYIYLKRSTNTTLMSVNVDSTDDDGIPNNTVLEIPNQCAICLCDYENGDIIVTSCNGECPHAFHHECVVEWLAKMQEDAPCPCCRRSFVDVNTDTVGHNRMISSNNNSNNAAIASLNPNNESDRHRERRRWRMSFGRHSSNNNNPRDSLQEMTEAERLRQEWVRHIIDQELRRRRAFNASVISLR